MSETTSVNVLFCPQLKDIQFTAKVIIRVIIFLNHKILKIKKLESENLGCLNFLFIFFKNRWINHLSQ